MISLQSFIPQELKSKLVRWLLADAQRATYESLFRDTPEAVISVTRFPYSGMTVRLSTGDEIDIPALPDSFMDQLVGFDRDQSETMPTWINIFSTVAVNAVIEKRAVDALREVSEKLGYELREHPVTFMNRLDEHLRTEEMQLAFVEEAKINPQ